MAQSLLALRGGVSTLLALVADADTSGAGSDGDGGSLSLRSSAQSASVPPLSAQQHQQALVALMAHVHNLEQQLLGAQAPLAHTPPATAKAAADVAVAAPLPAASGSAAAGTVTGGSMLLLAPSSGRTPASYGRYHDHRTAAATTATTTAGVEGDDDPHPREVDEDVDGDGGDFISPPHSRGSPADSPRAQDAASKPLAVGLSVDADSQDVKLTLVAQAVAAEQTQAQAQQAPPPGGGGRRLAAIHAVAFEVAVAAPCEAAAAGAAPPSSLTWLVGADGAKMGPAPAFEQQVKEATVMPVEVAAVAVAAAEAPSMPLSCVTRAVNNGAMAATATPRSAATGPVSTAASEGCASSLLDSTATPRTTSGAVPRAASGAGMAVGATPTGPAARPLDASAAEQMLRYSNPCFARTPAAAVVAAAATADAASSAGGAATDEDGHVPAMADLDAMADDDAGAAAAMAAAAARDGLPLPALEMTESVDITALRAARRRHAVSDGSGDAGAAASGVHVSDRAMDSWLSLRSWICSPALHLTHCACKRLAECALSNTLPRRLQDGRTSAPGTAPSWSGSSFPMHPDAGAAAPVHYSHGSGASYGGAPAPGSHRTSCAGSIAESLPGGGAASLAGPGAADVGDSYKVDPRASGGGLFCMPLVSRSSRSRKFSFRLPSRQGSRCARGRGAGRILEGA